MNYRKALDLCFGAISLGWIAWCLYWPILAREHDLRAIAHETTEAYRVCLAQPGVTPADCRTDRVARGQFLDRNVVQSNENPYQSFAGTTPLQTIGLMSVVCLAPPAILFAISRLALGACLYFARLKGTI